jgi:hypothetical protein
VGGVRHVEQFPDINKLCKVASCWIYEYIGILLGTRPIFHISRIKVKKTEDGIIPCTSYGCHEIKTGDAAPVTKQYHRVPWALREEMRGQIGETKEKKVVSDASIELPALAILITKKKPG